jgi:hypothetical protein
MDEPDVVEAGVARNDRQSLAVIVVCRRRSSWCL